MSRQPCIGLEIHVQLATKSKIFCACPAEFGDEPNHNVCPICLGYPGTLPALNGEAIFRAYLLAYTLKSQLASEIQFERKNYFYPDLPKNYQISQFGAPIGRGGSIQLTGKKALADREVRIINLREIHLEEDAGKMIHTGDISLLDYNRAGTPLLEIVTEPEIRSGQEAETLLLQLRRLVRYLAVGNANMEEGAMRCDANISISDEQGRLGNKVEIKNMNSSRFVCQAIDFEIARQQQLLERGQTVRQETRLWNENRDLTEPMRTKESSADYRYFPEPDLPPFRPDAAFLKSVADARVELPEERKQRMASSYLLTSEQLEFICEESSIADYFEACVKLGAAPALTARWLIGDVQKILRRKHLLLTDSPLSPKRLAELLQLLSDGAIHGKIAKQVLQSIFEEDKSPQQIIDEKQWYHISDSAQLKQIVDDVLQQHQSVVTQIQNGNSAPLGFLMGQIMTKTSGRSDPQIVRRLLDERLPR